MTTATVSEPSDACRCLAVRLGSYVTSWMERVLMRSLLLGRLSSDWSKWPLFIDNVSCCCSVESRNLRKEFLTQINFTQHFVEHLFLYSFSLWHHMRFFESYSLIHSESNTHRRSYLSDVFEWKGMAIIISGRGYWNWVWLLIND